MNQTVTNVLDYSKKNESTRFPFWSTNLKDTNQTNQTVNNVLDYSKKIQSTRFSFWGTLTLI